MLATKAAENEIVLTRTFAAPRDIVFAAMTQPTQLLEWMKTKDMAFIACDVDLRIDGTLRYQFQRPSGTTIEVRGTFAVVDVPRQWSYIETYSFSPLKVEVSIVLDESGPNTVFRQTLRYGSQAERDADFEGVANSSADAYENLDRYLASQR